MCPLRWHGYIWDVLVLNTDFRAKSLGRKVGSYRAPPIHTGGRWLLLGLDRVQHPTGGNRHNGGETGKAWGGMGCQKGVMFTAGNEKHKKTHVGPCVFFGGWRWFFGWFWGSCWGQLFFLEALTVGGKETNIRWGFVWLSFKQMLGVWHSVQNGLRDVGFGIGKSTNLWSKISINQLIHPWKFSEAEAESMGAPH